MLYKCKHKFGLWFFSDLNIVVCLPMTCLKNDLNTKGLCGNVQYRIEAILIQSTWSEHLLCQETNEYIQVDTNLGRLLGCFLGISAQTITT